MQPNEPFPDPNVQDAVPTKEWTSDQMLLWQRTKCNSPLDMAHCKAKQGMDYLETWVVHAKLNEVFGADGWSSRTVEGPNLAYGELGLSIKNFALGSPTFRCGYTCKVELTVRWADGHETTHTGTGFCSGMCYGPYPPNDAPEGVSSKHFMNPESAHDMASKGSESDALKRAACRLGWYFGLALYQKPDGQGRREHTFDSRDQQQRQQRRGAPR